MFSRDSHGQLLILKMPAANASLERMRMANERAETCLRSQLDEMGKEKKIKLGQIDKEAMQLRMQLRANRARELSSMIRKELQEPTKKESDSQYQSRRPVFSTLSDQKSSLKGKMNQEKVHVNNEQTIVNNDKEQKVFVTSHPIKLEVFDSKFL